MDFQFAVIQLVEERGHSVVTMRRSELSEIITRTERIPSDDITSLAKRMTLPRRESWNDRSGGLSETAIDLSRFDRAVSLINCPLLAVDDEPDPRVLVAPMLISDATMYSLSGLFEGSLQQGYWRSAAAIEYAGAQADARGKEFESKVAQRLREMGLEAWPRCKLSWALNEKVDNSLGDADVLAVSKDKRTVWIIEAKNLKLCRTIGEVAARLTDYRGRLVRDRKGREKPDKMLKHLQRVKYMRERRNSLCARLKLESPPQVKGLLVVDSPQPMNFHMLENIPDAESVFLDAIDQFSF